jgi:hypothetical protein
MGLIRETRTAARKLSEELRTGESGNLRRRGAVVGLSMLGTASLGLVALYQMGIIKHLPEPKVKLLNADKVDASSEAYEWLSTADALLGIASFGTTMVLAGMGGKDRVRGDLLAVSSCNGMIRALDRKTGLVKWEYDIRKDGEQSQFHGDPLVTDRLVVIGTDGKIGYVYAFEANDWSCHLEIQSQRSRCGLGRYPRSNRVNELPTFPCVKRGIRFGEALVVNGSRMNRS